MFCFSSILQQRYVLDKFASPLSERALLISKDFPISNYPYVPTGSHQHFHEERMSKAFPGLIQHFLQIIMWLPLYLQVVPNSHTKVALKE
jgi:hypothetical protein